MSADKQKKKARAFAWLREQRGIPRFYGCGYSPEPITRIFSGRPNSAMRYLVEKGLAKIARITRSSHRNRRNEFQEEP